MSNPGGYSCCNAFLDTHRNAKATPDVWITFKGKDNPRYGVYNAFYDYHPWAFWETSIAEPVALDITYDHSTTLSGYRFQCGEALPERMPVSWKLLASSDAKTWVQLDRRSITRAWTSNDTGTFQLGPGKPYQFYRFIFLKSPSPLKIMRIYHIGLIDRRRPENVGTPIQR